MTALCPQCVATSEEKRARLRQRLHVDSTGATDTLVFRVLTMPVAFGLSAVAASTASIMLILMVAERYNVSGISLLLAITAGASFMLMAGSWALVWLAVKKHEKPGANLALLCPPLLYKVIIGSLRSAGVDKFWEDIHIAFTAHLIGTIIFAGTITLAWTLDVNVFSGRSYVQTQGR
jgi:hypothetical protein